MIITNPHGRIMTVWRDVVLSNLIIIVRGSIMPWVYWIINSFAYSYSTRRCHVSYHYYYYCCIMSTAFHTMIWIVEAFLWMIVLLIRQFMYHNMKIISMIRRPVGIQSSMDTIKIFCLIPMAIVDISLYVVYLHHPWTIYRPTQLRMVPINVKTSFNGIPLLRYCSSVSYSLYLLS